MARSATLCPASTEDLRDTVADAAREGWILEARGGGSKRDIGMPGRPTKVVDLTAFAGVIDYEPSELVLTVRPATPLAQVQAMLAEHGQLLAFEPWDHGALFGRPAGAATIGGVIAAGVAGSRRVSAGGARDHLLGFEAVSGRGEVFRGGGKVVKNVTGYDVSKLVAGSWGQLVIMTELSLKVLPSPRATSTLCFDDLDPAAAVALMARAMGSSSAVSAAAHLPATPDRKAVTALRLEGFVESVNARIQHLRIQLASFGLASVLPEANAIDFWNSAQWGGGMAGCPTLWRVNLPPSRAAHFVSAVEQSGGVWMLDWAGALAWVGAAADCNVRTIAAQSGGHAALLRAPSEIRLVRPAHHPEPASIASLSTRLKQAFDPAGILDPLRFN